MHYTVYPCQLYSTTLYNNTTSILIIIILVIIIIIIIIQETPGSRQTEKQLGDMQKKKARGKILMTPKAAFDLSPIA